MGIERFSRTIPTSGAIETGRGNFALLLSASGNINVRAEDGGSAEGFDGVSGGLLIRRVKPWDNLRLLGAAGIAVEYILGHEVVDTDETDVRLQIATIAGVAAVRFQPFSTVTDRAPVAAANGAQSVLFAANPLRQKIRVFVDANNGVTFARTVGGANNICNLQPGSSYDFPGLYGLDVRNDSGAVANFYIFEEN